MLNKPLGVRIVTISTALIAGIVAGSLSFGHTIASAESNQSLSNKSVTATHVYPKNKSGQTYGSELYASSPDKAPDLISAVAVDGTSGYVRSVDLNEVMPKTPEEAIARQNKRKIGDVRKISVYDVDGKTVIGTFNVVNTQGIETVAGK